jgi:hypothetical protein
LRRRIVEEVRRLRAAVTRAGKGINIGISTVSTRMIALLGNARNAELIPAQLR